MNQENFAPPETDVTPSELVDVAPELWNPDSAGALSIFCTPAFGSFLVLKNWQAIGDEKRIRSAKIWFGISVAFFFLGLIIQIFNFLYLFVWYFGSQKRQTIYIRKRWNNVYPQKSWWRPLLVGLLVAVAYYGLTGLLAWAI